MALKNLVADKKKITEEAIENIISQYVRYDVMSCEVVFTPEGVALSGEKKLLVYLVAMLGWEYVVEDVPKIGTKPAQLESALGIHGGTLRPMIKKLSDAHLLTKKENDYVVQVANLDSIATVISGGKSVAVAKPKAGKTKKSTSVPGVDKTEHKAGKVKTGKSKAGNQLTPVLSTWVSEGFFSKARTLSDVEQRFHERAIIVKQSSLSGLLLNAVRHGQLKRTKAELGGKTVWVYSS